MLSALALAATLDALRAAPDRYAGRIIEVSGQLDDCAGGFCQLCPAEATPERPR